jgi:hypothetical protein
MSLFDPKSKEQCETALKTTIDHCKKSFEIELDLTHLSAKLAQLKQEKLDDYLLQRFKDWTVNDLSLCMKVIDEHVKVSKEMPVIQVMDQVVQPKKSAVVVEKSEKKKR